MPVSRSGRVGGCAAVAAGEVDIGHIPRRLNSAERHFDAVAEDIVCGWMQRMRAGEAVESPHGWFKRNMYRLIKAYVDADMTAVFERMAKRSGRSQVGIAAIRENPFKLALFAMWSDNESLSRHQQRVFGTQMMYAYLHGVPPEHLLGFIRMAGSPQVIATKLKRGEREPGFVRPDRSRGRA